VVTSPQNHFQDQLQRKHAELQQLIVQQQEELRRVSEQLLMARYGLLPLNVSQVLYLLKFKFNMITNFTFKNRCLLHTLQEERRQAVELLSTLQLSFCMPRAEQPLPFMPRKFHCMTR